MNKLCISILAAVLSTAAIQPALAAEPYPADVQVFFSPQGGAQKAVVEAVDHAQCRPTCSLIKRSLKP